MVSKVDFVFISNTINKIITVFKLIFFIIIINIYLLLFVFNFIINILCQKKGKTKKIRNPLRPNQMVVMNKKELKKKYKKGWLCTNLPQVKKSSPLPPFEMAVMGKTTKQKK